MKIIPTYKNLIEVADEEKVVFAINAELALGGLARSMEQNFCFKENLKNNHDNFFAGQCVYDQGLFMLVDKNSRYDTVDKDDLKECFESLKEMIEEDRLRDFYIPKIGCGADKLTWNEVSTIMKEVFADTDVNFYVCIKEGDPDFIVESDDEENEEADIVLERADLLGDDGKGHILVDKEVFDDYVDGACINIHFIEDSDGSVNTYIMRLETNDAIVMELLED